jgi:hypothetical protein
VIVVEYSYDDLTVEQRQDLSTRGFDLEAGESLYLMYTHLDQAATNTASGDPLNPGESFAVMDNSGNSYGTHAHVESAVNESGLQPDTGQSLNKYWEKKWLIMNGAALQKEPAEAIG